MSKTLLLIIALILAFTSCNRKIELPFTLTENNRIVFDANVNGIQGKYFWDTGSFVSHVNCSTDNLEPAYNGSLALLSSSDNLTYYTLDHISINGVQVKAVSEVARVTDSLQKKILDPEGLDGVLGVNIFEGYWCEVRFSESKIYLFTKKPSGYTESIKTELENNYLLINVNIDNIQTRFYLDTGDPNTLKLPESIAYKKNANKLSKVLTSDTRDYFMIPVNNSTVFNSSFKDIFIPANSQFNQVTLSGGTGIIGVNFLKGYNLLLDFTQLKLLKTSDIYYSAIVQNSIYFDLSAQLPKLGIISANITKDGLLVTKIIKDSELNLMGCRPNTLITKINNRIVSEFEYNEIQSMLLSRIGLQSVTVLENDNERVINFK